MVDIVFKNSGPWGGGKGSRLTSLEGDTNLYHVKLAIEDLQTNPLQPLQIAEISIIGNQMTITMSDFSTVFGPFIIPVAAFRWTGMFQVSFDYRNGDLFTSHQGMYLSLQVHTSDFTFDPDAVNVNGPLYQLIFPFPNSYQFGFFFPGQPGASIEDGRAIFQHVFTRDVILPAGLVGSVAVLEHAPADALSFPIQFNGTIVGSIDFAAYATGGTFNFPVDDQQLTAFDVFKVMKPILIDVVAKDLTVTLAATIGTLS